MGLNSTLVSILNMAVDFGQEQLQAKINDPEDPTDDEKAERIMQLTELAQKVLNIFVDDDPDNVSQLEEILDKMLDAGVNPSEL